MTSTGGLFARVFSNATVRETPMRENQRLARKNKGQGRMKLKGAVTLLLALASSSTLALAAENPKGFTYRYTKTIFVDGGGTVNPPDPDDPDNPDEPEVPETPKPTCGTFAINGGFAASGQSTNGDGDCVFASPSAAFGAIGFDYSSAEAFCASTMNGGGRVAKIVKADTFQTHSIVGAASNIVPTSFNIPEITSITCSTAVSPCTNGEFQDGVTCLPKTDLSCGRLNDDLNHYLPAGPNVEMAKIGQCTFQLPQVTIGGGGIAIMGEGQTMTKWVSTLASGVSGFDSFISAYSLSPFNGVDYALWKSNSNVPIIPKVKRPSVDYITIADQGYGNPATLPSSLDPTPNPSSYAGSQVTGKITLKFNPLQSGNGEAQIAEIEIFDRAGNKIPVLNTVLKQDGDVPTDKLTDGLSATYETFEITGQLFGRPTAVTLTFAAEKEIGSIAFRATSTATKFARRFEAYANFNDSTPLFSAYMLPYDISEPISSGQWARVLNPAFN
jgi:hypothetical protein